MKTKTMLSFLFDKIEVAVFYFTYISMVIIVFLQVGGRLIGYPLSFTNELARLTFVWMVFVGLSYAVKDQSHIRVTIFYNMIKGKAKKILDSVIHIITLGFFVFLLIHSLPFVRFAILWRTPALQISMLIFYIILPIAFVLVITRKIIEILKIYGNKPMDNEKGVAL